MSILPLALILVLALLSIALGVAFLKCRITLRLAQKRIECADKQQKTLFKHQVRTGQQEMERWHEMERLRFGYPPSTKPVHD